MQRRRWGVLLLTAYISGCLRMTEPQSSETASDSGSDTAFEIRYADENGTLQAVVDSTDVATASAPREEANSYAVTITLTEPVAERLVSALRNVGAFEIPSEHPIFVYFAGQNVYSFQLSRDLVESMENGDFQNDPRLVIALENEEIARDISDTLQK